jgi:NIMA (never in mitosis gene a)-related kinase 1/4/5
MKRQEHFPEKIIKNWFLQIVMALEYLHKRKVLHRDIKTSNIFITSCGSVKIGDFGIAKVLASTADNAMTLVGTPYYLSPEVCEDKPYTFKSDIWALGCVLYEMCSLKHPFQSSSLINLVIQIVKEKPPDIPGLYSKELASLVQ